MEIKKNTWVIHKQSPRNWIISFSVAFAWKAKRFIIASFLLHHFSGITVNLNDELGAKKIFYRPLDSWYNSVVAIKVNFL